jgi:hypothetical protein
MCTSHCHHVYFPRMNIVLPVIITYTFHSLCVYFLEQKYRTSQKRVICTSCNLFVYWCGSLDVQVIYLPFITIFDFMRSKFDQTVYAYLNNHLTFHSILNCVIFCYVVKIKARPIWAKL